MACLTRNPASARHAATADQSNALLQRQLPTKFNITVATVYQGITTAELPGQGGCWRLPVHARFRRPPETSAGACPLCLRRLNQPMLMAPSEARREARSTRESLNAKTEAVEDLET